ncbi:MAG: hypothetical protein ABL995_16265 [Bryobacteraceae bacterium]
MKLFNKTLLLGTMLCGAALQSFALGTSTTAPFNECPAIGDNTACAVLIIINPGGSLTVKVDGTQGPFDGSDDTLVGVLNNSGATVNSITLSGVGTNDIPIFGFENDGICDYMFSGNGYCSTAPTGYEGPTTTFSNISQDEKTGQVNFTGGLANGAATYFSLEDDITAQTPIVPPAPSGVPVPNSVLLVAVGLGAVGMFSMLRGKFARQN